MYRPLVGGMVMVCSAVLFMKVPVATGLPQVLRLAETYTS